jgi:predicted transcriptional regulator
MRKHGISQIPVVKKDTVVGSIQESTLIEKIAYRREQRNIVYEPVQNIMEDRFTVVNPSTNLEDVLAILSRGQPAVLVMDHEKLVGVITKIDVISSTLHTKK